MTTDSHDLGLILDSRVPLVVAETYEEKRALDMLLRVSNQGRGADHALPVYRWSLTDGLSRLSFGPAIAISSDHTEPRAVLEHIKGMTQPAIFALCDFHPFLGDDPRNIRLLKDIVLNHHSVPHTLVLISHQLTLPKELVRYAAFFQLSMPSCDQIMAIIREEAKAWADRQGGGRIKTDNLTLKKLVANLQGLTYADVRRLVRGAIVDDGAITEDDLPEVNKAKFALMEMEGILSFEYNTAQFNQVGGLNNLRRWLDERRHAFLSGGPGGMDQPKGILLLGVQGGGKSLAAKAVSGLWGLPLLRLDFGALYNKFFGETERNLRDALKLADTLSPCVLWMDEIEKGMAQDGHDNGTSRRVLGTLLTWMAERRSQVFVVATSNDISGLPPELVRKGRLDEIFFVDLPDPDARDAIFSIHMRKRDLEPGQFDLPLLVSASEGFSGAEIEQAVVAAIYAAAAQQVVVSTDLVLSEIYNTSPLSVVMGEKVAALRQWAEGRTVAAN